MPFPLTLVVATTPSMGIGLAGTLPWPSLRGEMAYFARITRRTPPGLFNAVVMGRKTWESIPSNLRPLKNRLNIVITRNPQAITSGILMNERMFIDSVERPLVANNLMRALSMLTDLHFGIPSTAENDSPGHMAPVPGRSKEGESFAAMDGTTNAEPKALYKVFIIGGSEIYKHSLEYPGPLKILRTRIMDDFKCDTFFPIALEASSSRWAKQQKAALDEWTGEIVPAGIQKEGEISWEFELWEPVV